MFVNLGEQRTKTDWQPADPFALRGTRKAEQPLCQTMRLQELHQMADAIV
jgi:hypothetical protein